MPTRSQTLRALRTRVLALAGMFVLGGCWTHSPAAPRVPSAIEAPAQIPADAWRPRDTTVLKPLLDATPSEVHEFTLRPGADESSLTGFDRFRLAQVGERVLYKGIHANALLRIVDRSSVVKVETPSNETYSPTIERLRQMFDSGESLEERVYGFVPNARALTSRTISNDRLLEALEDDRARREARRAIGAAQGSSVQESGMLAETLLLAGAPVRIPAPNATQPRARGLILHLHAIAGNGYEPRVMEEFARRGWAIVDFQPQTFVQTPLSPEQRAREKELLERKHDLQREFARLVAIPPDRDSDAAKAQNTTQTRDVLSRIYELHRHAAYQACPGADLDPIASDIAKEVDEAMSGAAYAVEAVLDYVRTQRPDLPTRPLVLMGFSAGALATPTVAARLGDQVDAVVVIGGGANVLRLSQESALTDGGLRIRCGEKKIDRPTLDRLSQLYLARSRLDPYHTAPLLAARGTPVLQVHASDDTWVPASGGELLFERLGRPERLTIHADHDLLFYLLPGKAEWIADWVDRAVTAR